MPENGEVPHRNRFLAAHCPFCPKVRQALPATALGANQEPALCGGGLSNSGNSLSQRIPACPPLTHQPGIVDGYNDGKGYLVRPVLRLPDIAQHQLRNASVGHMAYKLTA